MDPIYFAYAFIGLGVLLLAAELVLPTGFVLVVFGAISALVGVALIFVFGSTESGLTALLALAVGLPLVGGAMFTLWPYSPMARKLIKATEDDVTVAHMEANRELESLRNKVGRATSLLRPSGTAEFDGRRIDVVTEGMVVDAGAWVRVVELQAGKVVVRPTEPPKLSTLESADFG